MTARHGGDVAALVLGGFELDVAHRHHGVLALVVLDRFAVVVQGLGQAIDGHVDHDRAVVDTVIDYSLQGAYHGSGRFAGADDEHMSLPCGAQARGGDYRAGSASIDQKDAEVLAADAGDVIALEDVAGDADADHAQHVVAGGDARPAFWRVYGQ